jgi:glycerophosphoryl diester phosphodiesterase
MLVIGHRGARGLAPENTIASLKKALEHNVDEIEFDLRVTRDGIVVLHHDRDITDPNGQRRRIARHTYKELLDHKKDLTTFSEALDAIDRTAKHYIEVKPGEPIESVVAILSDYLKKGWKNEDFRLASFSMKTLMPLHEALPDITLVVNETWSGVRATHRARKLGTKRLSMSEKWLWSGFIRATSHGGYKLVAYTLNNPKRARRWERYGLYGVVTDYPDRFEAKS